MKRFVSATVVLLALASGSVWAEQPGNISVTQANHGGMIIPPSDSRCSASHNMGNKSEQLGAPYYHGNE